MDIIKGTGFFSKHPKTEKAEFGADITATFSHFPLGLV